MLSSQHHLADLSKRYSICQEDILFITLNICGLKSRLSSARARFRIRLRHLHEDQFYIILPLRPRSPFELRNDRIYFNDEPMAEVEALEHDDAVLSYFRNRNRVLTLNSNARSQCVGCAFCYTVLQDESDPRLRLMDDLKAYLTLVKSSMGWDSLAPLETLAVCTGCFRHEERAIDHLALMRSLLEPLRCNGNIHFLSSVIRTPSGFERIRRDVGRFHLTLTIECLSNRQVLLKESKASLAFSQMLDVMRHAREFGFDVDFTYIVGLDSLDLMRAQLPPLAAGATTFPRFQVFQRHNDFMETFASPEACDIEYFLQARQLIEKLFVERPLRPRSWENYRPLWYFSFANEALAGTRI